MIGAVSATTPAATGTQALNQLDTDAFLQLLVAQLRYQNPLEPTDGTAMLEQTAQFTTVETLQSISQLQQQLMGFSQVSLATSMIGKEVTAVDLEGSLVTGTVASTRFGPDGPLLLVDGKEVPLDYVTGVAAAEDT